MVRASSLSHSVSRVSVAGIAMQEIRRTFPDKICPREKVLKILPLGVPNKMAASCLITLMWSPQVDRPSLHTQSFQTVSGSVSR